MRGVGAEPAPTLRRIAPPAGHLSGRVREHRDVQDERRETRLADHTRVNRTHRQCLSGCESELGSEHVHETGGLCGVVHLPSFPSVPGERLFAHHVLPGGDRLEHDVGMCVGRRRHSDEVDVRQQQRLGQRRQGSVDLHSSCAFRGLVGVTTDQGPYGDPSSAQCAQVCEDTELSAHDDCAESGLAHVPPWDVQ